MNKESPPALTIFDDYRPIVKFAVLVRWVLLGAWFFILHYRVEHDGTWLTLTLMSIGLATLNAYMTWLVIKRQPINRLQAMVLGVADLTVISAALFLLSGFQNPYFVFYYPALLGLAFVSPGRLSFTVSAMVIAFYITMAFTVSPTLSADLEQEKWLVVRVFTMFGMVVAGTLIVGWERSRRREAVATERQKAEENLELQRKAPKAELAAVEERSRIAREIHDGIAQSIYMLSLNLETCADLAGEQRQDMKQRLDSLVDLSKETLLEVRHYIFDLKPYLAGEKGVASMVENQVREFKVVSGVATNLETIGEERQVPVPVATSIYRVAQEALSNTFKHAWPSSVNVTLEFADDAVQLEIRDDGRGFDESISPTGHGLRNMRQRAEELGGVFALESVAGKGTQVIVRLPVGRMTEEAN